ncbi:Modulator of FtsH protease HflC [Phycisphaerales bacterium]|nr:Modulator of FtsH protease HflC [Phycisphaerales bacterium]
MRKVIRYVVLAVFVAALFSFACLYTVRFTEKAVETRFGKAGPDALKAEPGLYFKLPYPFESVTKYDSRVRTFTVKIEQQQTADNKQVGIEAFCCWRVENPLNFFRKFSNAGERPEDHYREAEKALNTAMRSAVGVVSQYTMDDLFTTSEAGTKLSDLEKAMKTALGSGGSGTSAKLQEYGIEVSGVGVTRVVLPEETTKAVFDRMKSLREKIAKGIEAQGIAEADAIRAKADSDAKKIKEFALVISNELRARGDREATQYLAQMSSNSDLAVFLAQTDFLRTSIAKRTTLVLAGDVPGVHLLFPEAMKSAASGKIPMVNVPRAPTLDGRDEDAAPKANLPATLEGSR